jgi:hypothetical protein
VIPVCFPPTAEGAGDSQHFGKRLPVSSPGYAVFRIDKRLNGGRITGVGYRSTAPADKQLGYLRLPVGEKASLTEFLSALRGAKIAYHRRQYAGG